MLDMYSGSGMLPLRPFRGMDRAFYSRTTPCTKDDLKYRDYKISRAISFKTTKRETRTQNHCK